MKTPNLQFIRISAPAVAAVALWLAAGTPAKACKAEQRPSMVPNARLARSAALVERIGLTRRAEATPRDVAAPTIPGLWHTSYYFSGQLVDESFQTYHDDGTEMDVDQSAPVTGNVCNGVWTQTGTLTYRLTHPAFLFDTNGNLTGNVMIRDIVTLDRGGNQFTGTETVDVYDLSGRLLSHQEGTCKGVRITAN
jgi:hypothetical protein